ncbi:MAG: hypothetical protein WEE20_01270 [Bacteroidota bacterium]
MKAHWKSFTPLLGIAISFLPAALPLQAQIPGTDIYLVSLSRTRGTITVGQPGNITNRPGYDNQPSFFPHGQAILYTVIKEDGRADIFRYDIQGGRTRQVTETTESEYSPVVMPGGKTFSVVRVEMDSVQRLWQFNLNGSNPKLLFKDLKPVGYYAWGNANTVGLFILGNPPELHIATTVPGKAVRVWKDIGRSIQSIPRTNAISFIDRVSESEVWISRVDVKTRIVTPLIRAPYGSEFHAWTPDGTLLIAQGSRLLAWKPGSESSWREVADFRMAGIRGITRIAASPRGDRLVFVANE